MGPRWEQNVVCRSVPTSVKIARMRRVIRRMVDKVARWTMQQGLEDAERIVRVGRRSAARSSRNEAYLVTLLLRFAGEQVAAGRLADALASVREAIDICRRRVAAEPASFEVNLAHGLTILSASLTDAEQHEEALGAAQEAVAILQQHMPGQSRLYVVALVRLADALGACGQHAEAVDVAHHAVSVERRWGDDQPGTRDSQLHYALAGLSRQLSRAKRHADLVAVDEEIVAVSRRLRDDTRLARALNNASDCLLDTGRPADALAAADEAIPIWAGLLDGDEQHAGNASRARRLRATCLEQLGLQREVVLGAYPLCDRCAKTNGGLVAVRHRQVHVGTRAPAVLRG
jgi:tetratricopeptide (TPR) repeat protein